MLFVESTKDPNASTLNKDMRTATNLIHSNPSFNQEANSLVSNQFKQEFELAPGNARQSVHVLQSENNMFN